MIRKIILISLLLILPNPVRSEIKPVRLTCEYLTNPPVIDVCKPRLSWINQSQDNERGEKQTAYEIRGAESPGNLLSGHADLWNSGRVPSDELLI
jgi:alpha-L-rhamnosidase